MHVNLGVLQTSQSPFEVVSHSQSKANVATAVDSLCSSILYGEQRTPLGDTHAPINMQRETCKVFIKYTQNKQNNMLYIGSNSRSGGGHSVQWGAKMSKQAFGKVC